MKDLQALGKYVEALVGDGISFNKASRELCISPAELHALRHGLRRSPNPALLMMIATRFGGDYARMMAMAGYVPSVKPIRADPVLGFIPFYETITEEDFMSTEPVRRVPMPAEFLDKVTFLYVVPDDRMAGSRMLRGDTVLIRIQKGFKIGDVCCVFLRPNQTFLARVFPDGTGKFRLEFSHPGYAAMVVPRDKVKIIGVVIRVFIKIGE